MIPTPTLVRWVHSCNKGSIELIDALRIIIVREFEMFEVLR